MGNIFIIGLILSFEIVLIWFLRRTQVTSPYLKSLVVAHFLFAFFSIILLFKDMFVFNLYDRYRDDYYWFVKSFTITSYNLILLWLTLKQKKSFKRFGLSFLSFLGVVFGLLVGAAYYIFGTHSYWLDDEIDNYRYYSILDGWDHFYAGSKFVRVGSCGIVTHSFIAGEKEGFYIENYGEVLSKEGNPFCHAKEEGDFTYFTTDADTCIAIVKKTQMKMFFPPN